MGKINIVGCGPGSIEHLLPLAKKTIENSKVLVGSKKTFYLTDELNPMPQEKIEIDKDLSKLMDYLEKEIIAKGKDATILVTGDPGFYSLLGVLKNKFPQENFNIIPGVSSLQVAFARLNDIWHDAEILSLHGREENFNKLVRLLKADQKTALLLGNRDTHEVKENLIAKNVPANQKVSVCVNLSLPGEKVFETTIENLSDHPPEKDCIMIFKPISQTHQRKIYYTNRIIKDKEFIRDKVPMTKEEIRTIIVSRLKLFRGGVMWDIGAGTGSIAIQGSLYVGDEGSVFAIDHKDEAIALIKKNKEKFGCHQVSPIKGKAPEILKKLDSPDRVVIGGSDRKIKEILSYLDKIKGFKGPVVIPTIALETFEEAYDYFRNNSLWTTEVTKMQINNLEAHGSLSLWKSKNPVTIITAEKQN